MTKSKKIIVISIIVCLTIISGIFFLRYYQFKIKPLNQAQKLANTFEKAVRHNDRSLLETIVSQDEYYWEKINKPKLYQLLQWHFEKFHEGVNVYHVTYFPESSKDKEVARIYAVAKMSAKLDNKYRKYMEIGLKEKNGEWKLTHFYFPDFIDY